MRQFTRVRQAALYATLGTLVLAASSHRTRTVEVIDPLYHMNAMSMAIPDGWRFAGTVARPVGCHGAGPALKYTAQAPDGVTGFEMLPGVAWHWTSSTSKQQVWASMHCPVVELQTAGEFLLAIAVPMLHPNAKVISVGPLLPAGTAALAQQLAQARQQNAAMAARYGQPPQKLVLEGARVRIEFASKGHVVEEMLTAVIQCTEAHFQAMFRQPAYTDRNCSSRSTVLTTAPKGQLDAFLAQPQLAIIQHTIQLHPDWQQRVIADQQAEFNKAQAASDAAFQETMRSGKLAGERLLLDGKTFQDRQRRSTDAALAADRATQAGTDAAAHQTALYSADRGDFVNPSTGQKIEASSQYNHQWVSSDGSTLVQTNDHSYDPNGQIYINQSWTELQPIH
ncbi:MAG: hypothetical protein ABI446_02650 [Gemmatimonadaceae bacterium]